jgi:hypothetical protein
MPFEQEERLALLDDQAEAYIRIAVDNITREYPHMPFFVATSARDYQFHRKAHPAFYGSFDWHSCVEMYWVIVRLLRLFGDRHAAQDARSVLGELLTEANLAVETAFFDTPHQRWVERPYGWSWLLALHHELAIWEDPDGQHWARIVEPLANLLAHHLMEWLPTLTYPQRVGTHPNTAFALSRSLDHAAWRAERGDDALLATIQDSALRWFKDDVDYQARYEPSGADFLSAALCEAELMSRLLHRTEFSSWLDRFLPGLGDEEPQNLFQPVVVSDPTDPHGGHLHGLNLSRAWAFTALAERLAPGDPRIAPLMAAAVRQTEASLPYAVGSDYMVSHWLAAYATLLLS